jgi:hypothetical protein
MHAPRSWSPKILPDDLELFETVLKLEGHTVSTVGTTEGLLAAAFSASPPDVILLDLILDRANGLAVGADAAIGSEDGDPSHRGHHGGDAPLPGGSRAEGGVYSFPHEAVPAETVSRRAESRPDGAGLATRAARAGGA